MDKKQNNMSLREQILAKIGRRFLRKKYFFGRYSDCLMQAKQFAKTNNVIVQMLFHNNMKFYAVGESPDRDIPFKDMIVEEQRKEIKKRLRKEQEMTLYYVEDNAVTRVLGWLPTPTHYFLVAQESNRKVFEPKLMQMGGTPYNS